MRIVFSKSSFAFVIVMLTFVMGIAGSSSAKTQESIFTVIETEDPEYPTIAASIQLPFRVSPNNTVVLAGKHAYVTTEKHLHVIDVSIPQRPSYLTSLAFRSKIGNAFVSGHYVIVADAKKFHFVDVSEPSHPVIQSSMHLPHQHAIKDLDVLGSYLYVMGANDYLYTFSIGGAQAQLVKAVKMSRRWWLLSLKAGSPEVKQVLLSTSDPLPAGLSKPLLSRRGFLQLSSRQEKVRATSDFLAVESLTNPTCDLLIYDARRINDSQSSFYVWYFNVQYHCLRHLSATGHKTLTRRKPTIAYAVGNTGEMQQIALDQPSETIDVNNKRLVGPVTDFQFSKDLLYVTNAKGFFSIHRIPKAGNLTIEIPTEEDRDRVISVTPIQANHPISIAVGKHYVCVLAAPKDSRR